MPSGFPMTHFATPIFHARQRHSLPMSLLVAFISLTYLPVGQSQVAAYDVPALIAALEKDGNTDVRRQAAETLAKIGTLLQEIESTEALPPLG